MSTLYTLDEYLSDSFVFSTFGYELHIGDELVTVAFVYFPEQGQQILISSVGFANALTLQINLFKAFCGNPIGQWNEYAIADNPGDQNRKLHQQMLWPAAVHPGKGRNVGGGFCRRH